MAYPLDKTSMPHQTNVGAYKVAIHLHRTLFSNPCMLSLQLLQYFTPNPLCKQLTVNNDCLGGSMLSVYNPGIAETLDMRDEGETLGVLNKQTTTNILVSHVW